MKTDKAVELMNQKIRYLQSENNSYLDRIADDLNADALPTSFALNTSADCIRIAENNGFISGLMFAIDLMKG